jgi:hypothetical protein
LDHSSVLEMVGTEANDCTVEGTIMGGTLGAKTFPWPSAIGGSPLAQPLNQAQPVTMNTQQTQPGSVAPGQFQSVQPAAPPLSPLSAPIARMNPFMYGAQ